MQFPQVNSSEIHPGALGISRRVFWLNSVATPIESRSTNNAVDVVGSCDPRTSCLNDALGGVGVAVTSVLTITRMESRVA